MLLTRHAVPAGTRWAIDEQFLPEGWTLSNALRLRNHEVAGYLRAQTTSEPAFGDVLAPIEDGHELWASGVTYERSKDARKLESRGSTHYDLVYVAKRPELFFKANGWRVVNPGDHIGVRSDSEWNVPEPELTLVINSFAEVVGFTIGNDVSSRSIEGENPLYLPQAKVYDRSSSLGPAILIKERIPEGTTFDIELVISRSGEEVYSSRTSTTRMSRTFEELVAALTSHLVFPNGAFLMTGTGIVPEESFSLRPGDQVRINVPPVGSLVNSVVSV